MDGFSMSRLHNAEEKLIESDHMEAVKTLETFETRWRYAVFPAMVAFVILASFGFYLIYGMLQRMEDLSRDVAEMSRVIQVTMPAMQGSIGGMASDMHQLNSVISGSFPALNTNVAAMSGDMKTVSYSTASMANTTQNMGQNLWELNKNISKPFSMMNNIMPWPTTGTAPTPYYYPQ